MTPKEGDLRQKCQRFNGEEWVNCLQDYPQTKPLSDEEIEKGRLEINHVDSHYAEYMDGFYDGVKFAEERHGIK